MAAKQHDKTKFIFGREFYLSMFLDQFGVKEFIFDFIFVVG